MEKKKVVQAVEGKERIYRDEEGEKINTYKQDIDEIIEEQLLPLKEFLEIVRAADDDSGLSMAIIAQILLEQAEKKILGPLEYIFKNYGRIEVERAMYHQKTEPETMLGVVFTPCERCKEAAA